MLGDYIFCYDIGERKFVERYRVLNEGESKADITDIDYLTGVIEKDGVSALMADLSARFPRPGYEVSTAFANKWAAVENNYVGMRNH